MTLWADERKLLVEQLGEDVCSELEKAVADGKLAQANLAIEANEKALLKNIIQSSGEIWTPNKVAQEREEFLSDGISQIAMPEWQIQIDALQNSSDDDFRANMTANGKRTDVPWLSLAGPHEGHAVMVGGGSSLEIQLHEVSDRKAWGQTIFALNGAAKYLADHGI